MLDDSGPVFPSSGYSAQLHPKIRSAWNVDSLGSTLPSGFTLDDMGTINTALADEFPKDRLATTYFRRDMDYSLYSYERFYNFPPKEEILRMWNADTQLLTALYDTRDNLDYFIPYWRNVNDSHCSTLFSFAGSDIEAQGLTLEKWVNDFIDDQPIESAIEAPVPGEDPYALANRLGADHVAGVRVLDERPVSTIVGVSLRSSAPPPHVQAESVNARNVHISCVPTP